MQRCLSASFAIGAEKNKLIEQVYGGEPIDLDAVLREYMEYAEVLRKYVTDTSVVLNDMIDEGKRVLFEGAQGVMLDIDHGTYPYVTSSNPSAGGVCIGSGVGPTKIHQVIGVAKAYTTRVGDGPFPTELNDATGDLIRDRGHEYGTSPVARAVSAGLIVSLYGMQAVSAALPGFR